MPGGLYGYTGEADELHAVDLPRGRVIGGTTAVNSQIWVRATTEDFDYWSGALGCKTWSFANVLPFLILECRGYGCGLRNRGLPRRPRPNNSPSSPQVRVAGGGPRLARSLCRRGVCELRECQRTRDLGWRRCSGAQQRHPRAPELSAHLLAQARGRPNQVIRGDCEVRRVVFDDARGSPRAVGVELRSAG